MRMSATVSAIVVTVLAALPLAAWQSRGGDAGKGDVLVYVGTYTGGKTNSQGIYAFRMQARRRSTAGVHAARPGRRDRQPVVHHRRSRARAALRGQRDQRLPGQADGVGQRLLDRSRHRPADADQPAAVPGPVAVPPDARPERPASARRQLQQRHGRGAAGGGRRPPGRAHRRAALGQQHQQAAAGSAARALHQLRSGVPLLLRLRSRHRPGHGLPPGRCDRDPDGAHAALRRGEGRKRPAPHGFPARTRATPMC